MQVNNNSSFPNTPTITAALEKSAVKIRDQILQSDPVKQRGNLPAVNKEASAKEIEEDLNNLKNKIISNDKPSPAVLKQDAANLNLIVDKLALNQEKRDRYNSSLKKEVAGMLKSITGNKSGFVQKIDLAVLQSGPDKKPVQFECSVFRSSLKPYSAVFAKTPWGEHYTGLIQNALPFSIERGFIQGDQGSSYTAEIKYQRTGGSLHLKPLQKDGAEGHGVITAKTNFHNLEPQPTE